MPVRPQISNTVFGTLWCNFYAPQCRRLLKAFLFISDAMHCDFYLSAPSTALLLTLAMLQIVVVVVNT